MKLGVLLAGRRPEDIAQRLEQAREAGFSLCQLNLHQSGFTRADILAIADTMLEYGVRPLAIGCYVNPLRPNDASFNGACRADLDVLLHALDIIGARRVVFWSGSYGTNIYERHPKNASPDSMEVLRTFLTDVVRETRARHYYLCIEPWHGHALGDEQKALDFLETLEPAVRERVRFTVDAPSLLSPERANDCDNQSRMICQTLGASAGLFHLRDCSTGDDGEVVPAAPGQGGLDFPSYLQAVVEHAAPDAPAIVRNVPAPDYADVRDYLLRSGHHWELA